MTELIDTINDADVQAECPALKEEWLKHLPRYLKAISLRLERLARDPAKDRERSVRVAALWRPCRARLDAGERTAELLRFRFLLEEYRVSLFAQELGTAVPVSEARLARQWALAARPDDLIEAASPGCPRELSLGRSHPNHDRH